MVEGMTVARESLSDEPLSFDNFQMTPKSANNFFMFFTPHDMSEMLYREKSSYQALLAKDPKLAQRLCDAFRYMQDEKSTFDVSEIARREQKKIDTFNAHRTDLYKAYLLMRESGASDKDLFS